ncbi:MAG: N-6 DNA methylase [Methanobrevibacter sp.]|nr:N-6 DNA methylase [Methanobrevibacter sp.]
MGGGKLAIVLSEVIFHAPSYKKFRQEFFYKNNITDIIDLPHDTFRPYNNAKCIVIILEKDTPQNEFIRMINVNEIGHDHLGNIKYVFDYENHEYTNEINDDIPKIIDAIINNEDSKFIKYVDSNKVLNEDILVPRYYFDNLESIENNDINYKTLNDLIDEGIIESFKGHGSPKSIYKGTGNIPYVRVKDIVNNEVYINPLDKIPEDIAEGMRKNTELYESDIVLVRRGSYRIGDVGQLHNKDLNSIFTGELQFFRVKENNNYGLTNYNLFIILNSHIVREQFNHLIFIDTTLPTLYNRWNKLKIPLYSKKDMDYINNEGKYLFNLRKEYWEHMDELNRID